MEGAKLPLVMRLLAQTRAEFDRLRSQGAPIKALLIHRATNAEAEGVRGFPMPNGQPVGMEGAGHRDGGQRLDENGNPLFRDDPIVDVKGKPITNSAGQAFDFVMPAFRSVFFNGRTEDYQMLAGVVVRAGRLVAKLLHLSIMEILAGWTFSTPQDLWWGLLFEIAWAGRHPLLVAEKSLWLPAEKPNAFVPYNLQQLRGLATTALPMGPKIPENWLRRLPDAWLSELDDVLAASVDLADFLLTEATSEMDPTRNTDKSPSSECDVRSTEKERGGVTIRRRFAVALSFPGERRPFVGKVAVALRAAFGEPRVFYDRFHQEELSRPNLDLVLQRIYAEDADLVVVFVCGEYQEKEWCGLEWRAIRELMKSHSRLKEDVMFLRLDDKPLEGLLSIDGYLDISKRKPRAVADSVIKRWTAMR
jgi:TIR domain